MTIKQKTPKKVFWFSIGGGEGTRTPVRRYINKSVYRFIPQFRSYLLCSWGLD